MESDGQSSGRSDEKYVDGRSAKSSVHPDSRHRRPDVKYARLHNVTLDVASSTYANAPAKGVEMCRCPREYIGTSCQSTVGSCPDITEAQARPPEM
ncbi:hypothetical protein AVEN_265783-1 [Araneus ventricosus]|uniref:Uncharacterized protein n=1 Tax=Araneus ventricosus TaxID=182803 RepID=A0A4Y2L6Q8_ARAVE|nr:hypothetical protein AVEN_265783-1 [Araneus ventricosus]